MAVRKRAWTTKGGERRESWIVDYTDADGDRHIRTFELKRDADAFRASVRVDISQGSHTAPSKSVTVAEAGRTSIASGTELERTTVDTYRQHLELHIVPFLGPRQSCRRSLCR